MAGAAEEIAIRKMGPRALTFLGNSSGGVLVNCPKALLPALVPFVLGEDGTPDSVAPLVHGTYLLRVLPFPGASPFRVAVEQVNPRLATTVDPFVTGHFLSPGDQFEFFVDDSLIDGIVALVQCGASPSESCALQEIPIVTVNRILTTLLMSETGDTASPFELQPPPAPENLCGVVRKK